jgi:hypothetical protein
MAPLKSLFVSEPSGPQVRRNSQLNRSGIAADRAIEFVLLFHLSEKKKRDNPSNAISIVESQKPPYIDRIRLLV